MITLTELGGTVLLQVYTYFQDYT